MSSFSVYDDAVNNNEDNNAARQNYAYYFPNFWIKFICVEKFHDFFRLFCDPNFFFLSVVTRETQNKVVYSDFEVT